jgi:hypothetical protein
MADAAPAAEGPAAGRISPATFYVVASFGGPDGDARLRLVSEFSETAERWRGCLGGRAEVVVVRAETPAAACAGAALQLGRALSDGTRAAPERRARVEVGRLYPDVFARDGADRTAAAQRAVAATPVWKPDPGRRRRRARDSPRV